MRKLAIAALTVGILLSMSAVRVADFRAARVETLRSAETRAANLALILSEYMKESFAAGDAALRQLVLHDRRIGGPAASSRDWTPILASAHAGLASISSISVTDRNGVIRHSTLREMIGLSRRDDFVFRRAIAGPTDELIVGTPFPDQSAAGTFLIPLGRQLRREDGTIEGVVVASFLPSEARGLFETVDVGKRGALWVFHPDGVVLFREPSSVDPIGQPARENPILQAALAGMVSLTGPLEPGGPVLLSASRTLDAPPLIVAVSLDRAEVLGAWRRAAIGAAIFFAVAVLLLGSVLFVLYRQMDARAAAVDKLARAQELEAGRLREANERLSATLEGEQSARQEAEAASAIKDQFLMMVSHELRTPLTAISGWARILLDGGLSDARKQEALRTIERNANTQARLIGDLLDVSSVMTGKLQLRLERVEIGETVRSAVETIRAAATAKHLRISLWVDPLAGQLTGDHDRLRQIVWNLLSNAVKFSKPGGHVEVGVVRHGDAIEITVCDDGQGIKPEFLPHVFERFRQEDTGTTRRHGGLGLGLAIVRHLVELHGGTVAAASDGEGRGATFTVRLPADMSPVAGDAANDRESVRAEQVEDR